MFTISLILFIARSINKIHVLILVSENIPKWCTGLEDLEEDIEREIS